MPGPFGPLFLVLLATQLSIGRAPSSDPLTYRVEADLDVVAVWWRAGLFLDAGVEALLEDALELKRRRAV